MACPQIENGYTRIANELFRALCRIRIAGEARQVLDVIFCKTYGFNKKQDRISLSQFYLETGLKRPTICRAINKLLNMKLIIKIDNEKGEIYLIQKDFDQWKPLSKKITLSKKIMVVDNNDNASLSKKIHTKDNTTKDNTTKERTPKILWTKEILMWLEGKRKVKFAEYGKQLSALGRMKNAGYAPDQIKDAMSIMEKDAWWSDKSPDFVNLAAHIHKFIKKEDDQWKFQKSINQ